MTQPARYYSTCPRCGDRIRPGNSITDDVFLGWRHSRCEEKKADAVTDIIGQFTRQEKSTGHTLVRVTVGTPWGEVTATGVAQCSPEDKWDAAAGMDLATERLTQNMAEAIRERALEHAAKCAVERLLSSVFGRAVQVDRDLVPGMFFTLIKKDDV